MTPPSKDGIEMSVIVPIYNEEGILWEMAVQLAGHFDRIVGKDRWQYILVENGSRDSSPEITLKIAAQWPMSRIVELDAPNYGMALREGLYAADGDYAHIINVDQWDIPFFEFAWSLRDRYALILGSKRADPTLNHQTPYRRLLSWGLNAMLMFLFEYTGADSHGPKLINLRTLRDLCHATVLNRGQFDTELTLRAFRGGYWIAEIPTNYMEKRPPRNWMITKILRNFIDLYRLRKIMVTVPYAGTVNLHRWARWDVDAYRSDSVDPG